jgi:hypothetical protein
MSSHDITLAGYLLFVFLGIGLNLLAHRRRSRIPTIGQVFGRIMHTRTGRIAVVAWWAFLGLHLFSK